MERRATKRRYNEEQSDAELVEWDSDDETDSDEKQRAISKSVIEDVVKK